VNCLACFGSDKFLNNVRFSRLDRCWTHSYTLLIFECCQSIELAMKVHTVTKLLGKYPTAVKLTRRLNTERKNCLSRNTYLVLESTCWTANALPGTKEATREFRAPLRSARLSSRARKQMMSTIPTFPAHRHNLSFSPPCTI
jgi:hypothetical protein